MNTPFTTLHPDSHSGETEPAAHLARDVAAITGAARRLHALSARLIAQGAQLPAYLYIRPLQAEIVFTRPASRGLARLFGGEGWRREAAGASFFDWIKRVEEGVTLRISECEPVASPLSEVPPEVFGSVAVE